MPPIVNYLCLFVGLFGFIFRAFNSISIERKCLPLTQIFQCHVDQYSCQIIDTIKLLSSVELSKVYCTIQLHNNCLKVNKEMYFIFYGF